MWLCSPSDVPSSGFQDLAVIVMDGNCSIMEKAVLAEKNNAKMLLLATREGLVRVGGAKVSVVLCTCCCKFYICSCT